MAKEIDHSFWISPDPPEDWEGLVSYLRPRGVEELHELFDVKPPTPPDPNAPPDLNERRASPSLLEQLHIRTDEFVELALQQPTLWSEDELDYLYLVASEGEGDERLDALARDYFSGARHRKKAPPPHVVPEQPLDTSLEMTPDLLGTPSIPDLDVLEGTMNVDRWWEKQK